MNEYIEHIKNIINRESNLFAVRTCYDVDCLNVFKITPIRNVLICTISIHGKQIFSSYSNEYVLADWKTRKRRYYSISTLMTSIKRVIGIKELKGEDKMEELQTPNFSLNTNLIPALKKNGIKFRYIGGVYDPMTIIVTHKNLDICRIDMNRNRNEGHNYDVYWFPSTVRNTSLLQRKYLLSKGLIDDICKVINFKGEDKMDKNVYRVSGISVNRSSLNEMDEITFTVNILRSRYGFIHATQEDCDRIKEAIENIGENDTNESSYIICGRKNGKTKFLRDMMTREIFSLSFDIKDVIFNNPATIVFWKDGTKTVVKAENEEFDPEKGLAMAITKKALGNCYGYYDVFKKYVGRYEKKQKKGGK